MAAAAGDSLLRSCSAAASSTSGRVSCQRAPRPQQLVAGQPATVYYNRLRSGAGLQESPNVRLHYGWSGWGGAATTDMRPAPVHRDWRMDWWSARVDVPRDATDMQFVFGDGHERWDNNGARGADRPARAPPLV